MVKKRVHEIAKELNIESKEVIQQLSKMGVKVKSHMSTLEDNEAEQLLNHFKRQEKRVDTVKNQQKNNTAREKDTSRLSGSQNRRNRPDRGPGLVDRVPSRPPDRRFTEKPVRASNPGGGIQNNIARPKKKEDPPRPANQANQSNIAAPQQGLANQSQPKHVGGTPPERQPKPVVKKQQEQPRREQPRQEQPRQEQTKSGHPRQHKPAEQARRNDRNLSPRDKGFSDKPQRFQKNFGPQGAPAASPKIKDVEKGKPDKIKALEKTKAQERIKQIEKQAFKEREVKVKFDKGHRFDRFESRIPGGKAPRRKNIAQQKQAPAKAPVKEKKPIVIGESITVKSLAEKISISAGEVIKKLMELGVLATINQEIDSDTATLVANDFGFQVDVKIEVDKETMLVQEQEDDPDALVPRPCVVTIMGHVDHGKTSLLDAIRKSNVIATEAGGITQHIGAYQVEHKGKKITFVDTPGHEAFTAMRARGAKITDIAILVVAADDGVMPQTVEAINHARAADVPIIVAVNKIDKEDAQPEKVKRQLTEYNLVAEEWGGDTIFVEVSAKEKQNLNELLEMILLVAEIGEYKANPNRAARGTVIEAELDKGRGPVATVLVQNGTLKVGDFIIAGVAYGKVRAMMDHTGRRVKKAGPSMPVEVLGLSEVPPAGELFYAVEDEKLGRQVILERQVKKREEDLKVTAPKVSLDDLFNQIQEGQVKELNIIIKADVQGSVEAVKQALQQISTEEVRVNAIHGGVGAVTESDIMLASASNAIIIGFNVRPDVNARKALEAEKVDIRLYRVIYDAVEDIKAAMSGLLEPDYKEVVLGRAEVRKTFKVSKVGTIAGCYVTEGKITRDAGVRVIRDGIVIHEGTLESLKRFKDDAREVNQGYECGITIEKFNDIREGDQLEAYTMEAVKRELA
ncbi:translation initiation factor IF-2 [Desulfotruncus alcoholivorax]|uniref:translation initiation factor IF-2 n=1 Tax=Desulfotruncus alcoholivorax TaxID=265477 RepID=UPI00041CC2CA|nr:translation initiation factor IF-2 [Desulfotruncus alcoholivorax]